MQNNNLIPSRLTLSVDFLKSMEKTKELPLSQLKEWAEKAIEIGLNEAINYESFDVKVELQKAGIRVEEHNGGVLGNKLIRALYDDSVKTIIIYSQGIDSVLDTPAAEMLGVANDRETIREILICHEYFHYLEFHKIGLVGEGFRLPQKTLGFTRQKPVYYVSEISANAFAERVMRLNANPFILDYLLQNETLWRTNLENGERE